MPEPPSPTVGDAVLDVAGTDTRDAADSRGGTTVVVAADEQSVVEIDLERWRRLAAGALRAEGFAGELTLTFVGRDEIAALNRDHRATDRPTDVLAFPLDAVDVDDNVHDAAGLAGVQPRLLGDVVVCPEVAAAQAPDHAGTLDDELALLVVHGVLHVLGHDHAAACEAMTMRAAELHHLEALHWGGPAPAGFRQEHRDR